MPFPAEEMTGVLSLLNSSRKFTLVFHSWALLILWGKYVAWENQNNLFQLLHVAQILLALCVKFILHNLVFVIQLNLSTKRHYHTSILF